MRGEVPLGIVDRDVPTAQIRVIRADVTERLTALSRPLGYREDGETRWHAERFLRARQHDVDIPVVHRLLDAAGGADAIHDDDRVGRGLAYGRREDGTVGEDAGARLDMRHADNRGWVSAGDQLAQRCGIGMLAPFDVEHVSAQAERLRDLCEAVA